MRSINKVILIGNITRDPELKQTTNGQSIVTFGLATNREWVTSSQDKHSLAEYHNIVAWGKLAEICNQYLKKGKLIYVEGYLKTRSWDSPEGVKIFKTEVVIYDMIMLEKRPQDGDNPSFTPNQSSSTNTNNSDDMFDPSFDMDGIDAELDGKKAEPENDNAKEDKVEEKKEEKPEDAAEDKAA